MANVLVVHGPNLNLLGEREPEVYGRVTLAEIDAALRARAKELGAHVRVFQSNGEGALIDFLHAQRKWADGVIINPGAYTHYSYAIRDAIAGIALSTVEVHLSDISTREEFRRISVIEPVCIAQFKGKGLQSYVEALDHLVALLQAQGK